MAIEQTLSAEGFSESLLLQKMSNMAYGGCIAIKHGNVRFIGTLTLQISYDKGGIFHPFKIYTGPQCDILQAWEGAFMRIGFAKNDYVSGEAIIFLSSEVGRRRNRTKMRSMV